MWPDDDYATAAQFTPCRASVLRYARNDGFRHGSCPVWIRWTGLAVLEVAGKDEAAIAKCSANALEYSGVDSG